jgi:mono/diheme cytochrome c family protein
MRACAACIVATVLALGGCERQMRNMYDQPRLDPGEASNLWPDGKGTRPPPPGAVAFAMGDLAATSSGRRGRELPQQLQRDEEATAAPQITPALLERGQQRFDVYCQPCHSRLGDGDGPVTRRGFPHPPSYHEPRLLAAPDRHFYDVITQGYGIMVPYADRVAPGDRWAIVAYIRALQLSQHAQVSTLPPRLQTALSSQAAASQPATGIAR